MLSILPHRSRALLALTGLTLLAVGAPLWAQSVPPVPRPVQSPVTATPIIIPGATINGVKQADTVVYEGTTTSGDFCTVTKTLTTPGTVTAVCVVQVNSSQTVTYP